MIPLFSKLMTYRKEHPLGYRMLLYILLFSSFFTLMATSVQLYLDYRKDVSLIEKQMQQIQDSYLHALLKSVWYFDDELIKAQMKGILQLPDIQYLELRTGEKDAVIKIGKSVIEKHLTRQFPLIHNNRGKISQIGTLHAVASLERTYHRLYEKAVVILCTQAVKTFFVSAFILFIFQYLVTRHLNTMAEYAQQFALNNLEHPLKLKRGSCKPYKQDELDKVVNSINEMRMNLLWDMAERKRSQEELKSTKNYLDNIINSMPSVLLAVDAEEKISLWNIEAEDVTGISAENARGHSLKTVFPQLAEHMEKIHKTLTTRRPQKQEKVVFKKADEIRYSDIMAYPLITNGVEGVVLRIDDVTERVRIEEMMIQSEKMMSVGGLAAGMAHEINNPLGGILQSVQNIFRRISDELPKNIQIAQECGTNLDAVRNYMEQRDILFFLEGIRSSGKRAAAIVANMLSFSRRSKSKMSSVNLANLLDKTVELASHDYDLKKKYDFRHIEIIREYEPDMPEVICTAPEIEQVFLNLLRNAAQAMADSGRKMQDSALSTQHSALSQIIIRLKKDHSMAQIEVEDNGLGMDKDTKKRVFEPFFTTKDVGSGTGLGLSVSYFIITNNHKGTMTVESEPGKGTKFIIRLPL